MKPTITIELFAGLGNRMRVLDSGIQLAQRSNSKLNVLWNLERDFNCKFDELFRVPDCIDSIKHRDLRSLPRRTAKLLDNKLFWLTKLHFDNHWQQHHIMDLVHSNADLVELTKNKSTFISTFSRFFSANNFNNFHVTPPLEALIRSYTDQFNRVVGVHIRRSDNIKAIECSPTSLFISYMNDELKKYPETKFFLATDSPETEIDLKAIFGNRIISHTKRSLNRDNPDAIKDATIDLYCLSNCRKIFGSYWSSFTSTAAEVGGIKMIVVKTPD